MSRRVVLATRNAGKLAELRRILADAGLDVELVGADAFAALPDVHETGSTFAANALLKARAAAEYTGLPAIADDSGLEVDYLHGAPGIYSARYAGVGSSDEENLNKLLQAMQGVPEAERSARFQCVIAFMRHGEDPTPMIFQGSWEGRILDAAQGDGGFGYDPVFFVPTHNCSSAQLPAEEKNRLSHRGQALAKFIEAINQGLHL